MDQVDGVNQIMTHFKATNIAHRTLVQRCWLLMFGVDDIGVDVGLYCKLHIVCSHFYISE